MIKVTNWSMYPDFPLADYTHVRCAIMDDSTNVLSSVWENGKIIKPNTLYNLKKSTSFGELFEKTVGNDQTLLNVEVECSVSDGKSTNPVIVNLSNDL